MREISSQFPAKYRVAAGVFKVSLIILEKLDLLTFLLYFNLFRSQPCFVGYNLNLD